jgi:hypothetical protein
VFSNVPTVDDYRNEALIRGLDLPEWPHERYARSIAGWALLILREKNREDDGSKILASQEACKSNFQIAVLGWLVRFQLPVPDSADR